MTKSKQNPEEVGALVLRSAQELSVTNQVEYDYAADFLRELKTRQKDVESVLEPQCKAAYDSWQVALEQKKKFLAPFTKAESAVKLLMSEYQMEQRRVAEEAERKAQEEAAKQEEKERQKLLKKAGRCKDPDKAAELEAQAEMVFVPVVTPSHEVTKAQGVSTTVDFDVEIHDIRTFLRALVDGQILLDPNELLTVKIQPIKQYIKLTKTTKIPGVRIKEKINISARGK